MSALDRYEHEASTPAAPALHETIRYVFDETQRRAYHSTKGLTAEDLSHEPGHGAWSIGAILHHQLRLVRFITHTLEPGSVEDLPLPDIGQDGRWNPAAIVAYREVLAERFREVFARVSDETLMGARPDVPPPGWADWPVLMRILRPLTDLATHVGQVNYARRQLGKPVERT
jgi:hypothetical protein